jgi:hypothetical protein
MNTTDYQSPGTRDPEFHGPEPKVVAEDLLRPRSGLAVTSLVFGILAWTVLPVVGALIAIVTGHMGLSEVQTEGGRLRGRPQAKAGLILGYLQLLIAAAAAAVVAWLLTVSVDMNSATVSIASNTTSPAPPNSGVRMLNEMTTEDFRAVKRLGIEESDETIIGISQANSTDSNDLAILTNHRIASIKDGRVTELPLKDVEAVLDQDQYQKKYNANDYSTLRYMFEVKGKSGARMRISVTPSRDGPFFYQAVKEAWTAAGGVEKAESK